MDLAAVVDPGSVDGIDLSSEVIENARREAAERGVSNVNFNVDDVYRLRAADSTYDVVHAHQVLQHLTDPVGALREMHRVLRDGGLLAIRDADFASFAWYPLDDRLTRWMELYHELTLANRAEADAGRRLVSWAMTAGFVDVEASSSNWTFHRRDDRAWWGGLWADRIRHSAFAEQSLEYGLTSRAELDSLAAAFLDWSTRPDGVFIVVHGEVLARRGDTRAASQSGAG